MRNAAAVVIAAGLAAAATPCLAQTLTREELENALAQRDQVIAALEKRVAALEAERGASAGAGTAGAVAGAAAVGPSSPGPSASASVPSAPGGASDDEAALRALSRGLVQRGLLLLPPWNVEASPGLSYSHTQAQGLVLADNAQGVSTVQSQRQREDAIEGSLSARIGLPWRSQLQLIVPFDWRRQDTALGNGVQVTNSAAHVGDVQLELSHQFLVESGGWVPDLIGAIAWRAPTGSDPYRAPVVNVASGLGTSEVTARVTALKTLDPLAVFSTLSYSRNFKYRESFGTVRTGDLINWQMGALLAVSPDTSLSFGFSQQFKFVTRVDGARIPGSDGVAAMLQFGLDQVLSPRTLLDISVGVGVTRDAPDYTVMVSLPIRFR
ncbi:MAG: transporter [Caulobacteraceae bacterium]|nr:transporter [Caulobacteraceae bacterium]